MLDFFRVIPKKRSVRLKTKSGVLFSNPNIFRKIIFYLGTILFVACIVYFVYLFYPLTQAEVKYTQIKKLEEPVFREDEFFAISIPKIGARANVITGISPYNPGEYLSVLNGNMVAQSNESQNPGKGNGTTSYLFAHSTEQSFSMVRKNAVFYLLNKLTKDDVIYVKIADKVLVYKVFDKKIITASDLSYMKYTDPNKEILILQTCWPLGTNWKRLLIFANHL